MNPDQKYPSCRSLATAAPGAGGASLFGLGMLGTVTVIGAAVVAGIVATRADASLSR